MTLNLEFDMIVEGNNADNAVKKITEILVERRGELYIEFTHKKWGRSYAWIYIEAKPFRKGRVKIDTYSGAYRYGEIINEETAPEVLSKFGKAIAKIDPELAVFTPETGDYLQGASIEYYRNPYFFCFEPERFTPVGEGHEDYAFLDDPQMAERINEIKKKVSEDEIINWVKKYSEGYCKGKIGLGKINLYSNLSLFPRVFILKELEKKGLKTFMPRTKKFVDEFTADGSLQRIIDRFNKSEKIRIET